MAQSHAPQPQVLPAAPAAASPPLTVCPPSPTWERASQEAIIWRLRLQSAEPDAAACKAFEQWLAADAEHAHAWQRVNDLLGVVRPRPLVVAAPTRRRPLRWVMAVVAVAALAAGVAERFTPLASLDADLRTGTGEHLQRTLADGSQLTLDARSAVDVGNKAIRLREGALQLSVPANTAQPLSIASRDAQLFVQDAQLLLRQMPASTLLTVLKGRVRVELAPGISSWVQAGQVVRLKPKVSRLEATSLWARGDWAQGRVELRDEPLGDLLEALRSYHPGVLRVSAQAERLPVTGSFSLADLDGTLTALQGKLPVHVQRVGGWAVQVE